MHHRGNEPYCIQQSVQSKSVTNQPTKIQAINSPQNPHVFSYKKYLERKGIYHLITIDSQGGSLTKKGRKSIKGMVFDVGFQFSCGAVLGILVIKPILDHFWRAKHFIIKPIITLLNVSIAAQIGILPLSLYYFYQFPGLFFLANLLIIPTLTLCLWLGFL